MTKPAKLPVEGKAIRFAPGRGLEPSASFWKVWAQSNEIYASGRSLGGIAKISVHQSGRIHYSLGVKNKQDMAPPMQIPLSDWLHAFEMRFLISGRASAPTGQRESLKNKSAYLIPVPDGKFLVVNLLIGPKGTSHSSPLPAAFSGANALWRVTLPDRRAAVLIGRILDLDDENRKKIEYYHQELKLTVTTGEKPKTPYGEIFHFSWSDGGNFVFVVPLGPNVFRTERDSIEQNAPNDHRVFHYQSPQSVGEVIAPNTVRVAKLQFDDAAKTLDVVKNEPDNHELGIIRMELETDNLVAGSSFIAAPCKLSCVPRISGASPREWVYLIYPRFDGYTLSAEIRQQSSSLQNKNLSTPLTNLGEKEELAYTIPRETLTVVATLDAPVVSAKLFGRFQLRDSR